MSYKVYARHGGAVAASLDDITARVPALDLNVPQIEMGMSCQNGAASQGTILVPDPVANQDGSLYFPPHTLIRWTEDASGDELWLAQGRISGYTVGRPDYQPGDQNVEWSITVDDANRDLDGLAFTEAWVRPEETGTARLYALQAYTLNGTSSTRPTSGGDITYRPSTTITISSTHLAPDTETTLLPAKTYPADTEPRSVVDDCATTEGKVYGVVLHHVGGASHLCLLYVKETDHATYASTCKISEDIADWNPEDLTAPVFVPIYDQGPAQRVDGNANISGIVSRYGTDNAYVVQIDTTAADDNEYWNEAYQDGESETATQAIARANSILEYRTPYMETDAVSIDVLPEQAHLITAGMSIQIKSAPVNTANVSTAGTYVDRRIVSLQWRPRPDGLYHGILQLNRPRGAGLSAGSALPKSQLPAPSVVSPCPCIESFNRTVAADGGGLSDLNGQTWVIDSVSGDIYVNGTELVHDWAGNMHLPILTAMDNSRFELLFKARLEGPTPADPRGTLELRWQQNAGSTPLAHARIKIRARETGSNTELAADGNFTEGDGAGALSGDDFGTQVIYPYVSGGEDFMVHISVDGNTMNGSVWLASGSPPDAWGFTYNQVPACNYNNTNGSIDRLIIETTNTSSSEWHIDWIQVLAGMWCCANEPVAGQYVNDIIVGYGNGTAVYSVPSTAYTPGSLRVWVDGLEQTAAVTESDPTTGEFDLSFTPDDTELITASYQVA